MFIYIISATILQSYFSFIILVLKTLENLTIDSLIIWYPETMIEEPSTKLLDIWSVLEEYVREGRVKNLGIADLDTKVFVSLYNQVKVF